MVTQVTWMVALYGGRNESGDQPSDGAKIVSEYTATFLRHYYRRHKVPFVLAVHCPLAEGLR